jgi:hypothetical protein
MTFGEAVKIALAHGGQAAASGADSAPDTLPSGVEGFDEWRTEALHGAMRESFWMHKYHDAALALSTATRRLEDAA